MKRRFLRIGWAVLLAAWMGCREPSVVLPEKTDVTPTAPGQSARMQLPPQSNRR